jgi:hypothetical protein
MRNLERWKHRWFGVWREYGPGYEACPSARDFVFPEITRTYDKRRLKEYLTNAHVIASTSRSRFPCPFTGRRTTGSISFRTDGHWLWLDDLADYVDRFDIAIPSEFLENIEKNGFTPPVVLEDVTQKLEWPPVKRKGSTPLSTLDTTL